MIYVVIFVFCQDITILSFVLFAYRPFLLFIGDRHSVIFLRKHYRT